MCYGTEEAKKEPVLGGCRRDLSGFLGFRAGPVFGRAL